MGLGALINISRKQKCNTKISTKTKLVGVDDIIATILRALYFMQAQGVPVKTATIV